MFGAFADEEWSKALSWDAYVETIQERQDIWASYSKRANVSVLAQSRLDGLPGKRRALVLTEDWCGDAARSVPQLEALFSATDNVDARYLLSDRHPDVIQRYTSHGGHAIPMCIVQDDGGSVLGVWGPRPAALQTMLRARKVELGPSTKENLAQWYAPILAWYARDKGVSITDEILLLLERG